MINTFLYILIVIILTFIFKYLYDAYIKIIVKRQNKLGNNIVFLERRLSYIVPAFVISFILSYLLIFKEYGIKSQLFLYNAVSWGLLIFGLFLVFLTLRKKIKRFINNIKYIFNKEKD